MLNVLRKIKMQKTFIFYKQFNKFFIINLIEKVYIYEIFGYVYHKIGAKLWGFIILLYMLYGKVLLIYLYYFRKYNVLCM